MVVAPRSPRDVADGLSDPSRVGGSMMLNQWWDYVTSPRGTGYGFDMRGNTFDGGAALQKGMSAVRPAGSPPVPRFQPRPTTSSISNLLSMQNIAPRPTMQDPDAPARQAKNVADLIERTSDKSRAIKAVVDQIGTIMTDPVKVENVDGKESGGFLDTVDDIATTGINTLFSPVHATSNLLGKHVLAPIQQLTGHPRAREEWHVMLEQSRRSSREMAEKAKHEATLLYLQKNNPGAYDLYKSWLTNRDAVNARQANADQEKASGRHGDAPMESVFPQLKELLFTTRDQALAKQVSEMNARSGAHREKIAALKGIVDGATTSLGLRKGEADTKKAEVDARFAEPRAQATLENLRAQTSYYGKGRPGELTLKQQLDFGDEANKIETSHMDDLRGYYELAIKALNNGDRDGARQYMAMSVGATRADDVWTGGAPASLFDWNGEDPKLDPAAVEKAITARAQELAMRNPVYAMHSGAGAPNGTSADLDDLALLDTIPETIKTAKRAVAFLTENHDISPERAKALVRSQSAPPGGVPGPKDLDWSSAEAFAKSAKSAGIPKEDARRLWKERE